MVKTMHKLFTRDAEAGKKSEVHSDQNMIKVQKSVAMEWGAVIGLALCSPSKAPRLPLHLRPIIFK